MLVIQSSRRDVIFQKSDLEVPVNSTTEIVLASKLSAD